MNSRKPRFSKPLNGLTRSLGRLGACAASLVMSAQALLARAPADNSFKVEQPIDLEWSDGTVMPQAKFWYSLYAFACTNQCVSSAGQGQVLSSEVPITAGVPIEKILNAVTTDSTAKSRAFVSALTLQVGSAKGSYETTGEVKPRATGCPPPANGAGRASVDSRAKVVIKTGSKERKGKAKLKGEWENLGNLGANDPSTGIGKNRMTAKDPIVARLIDNTTAITTEYVLGSVLASASDGFLNWTNGMLSSNAQALSFDFKIESPVTQQQGLLRLVVDEGVVIERIATGLFAGMGFPDVGQPGNFAVPLPEITLDFDLGGDETHDLETEFDFSGGVEDDGTDGGLEDGGSLINDIGVGFEGSSVSIVPPGDSNLGFALNNWYKHLAERFHVEPGTQTQLASIQWPVYQIGVDPELGVAAAYARIWQGDPMNGGVVIAGDMTTNHLLDVHPTSFYRVGPNTLTSNARKVKNVMIDLQWVPPLSPGEYWIEVAMDSIDGGALFSPTCVWKSTADNAIWLDVEANQWNQVKDTASQRLVSFPFRLFGEVLPGISCPTDVTQDGLVNVDDLLMVVNQWGQFGAAADVTGDGWVNVNDLLAVISAWGSCL